MKPNYRTWLEAEKYEQGTVNAQMYRASRVEEFHGDLDLHYSKDRFASLLVALRYSSADKRRGRPNPSKIPIDDDIKSHLASYRNAVERYRRFLQTADGPGNHADPMGVMAPTAEMEGDSVHRIGLERDMQAALRVVIDQLESGLTIIDDGAEQWVQSGFIDITARDSTGVPVVIKLKAGLANQRSVAEILSSMGDLAAEDELKKVRGILVASEFDAKAKAAARMVPDLLLRRYSVQFKFKDA